MVCSERELREERAGRVDGEAGLRDEGLEQSLVPGKDARALRKLSHDDTGPDRAAARRQRQLPEQRLEQRRLAGPISAEEREPVSTAKL